MAKRIGRPPTDIDKKSFENLCAMQCTLAEIAGFFRCSDDTIERWCEREYQKPFAEVFGQSRVTGQISLRRAQFRLAQKSANMAIWLGKQYLEQVDKRIVDGNLTTTTIIDDIPKAADDGADN